MRKHSIKRIVEVEFLNDNTLNPLLVKSCHKCKGLILIAHEAKNLCKEMLDVQYLNWYLDD